VDVPLPWERVLWSGRPSPLSTTRAWRERYLLTDFRLVRVRSADIDEVAIQDIGEIHRRQSRRDRLLGTSTVEVQPRDRRRSPLVLRHIRRGAQVAALLELLAGDPYARIDAEAAVAALAWQPREPSAGYAEALAAVGVVLIAVLGVAIGLHGKSAAIVYPRDDAISPNGQKQPREVIVRFMKDDVMPWAKATLGPLKGGSDRIVCETCHGRDAIARGWLMPGVAALPEPDVKDRGWERYGGGMDAQMRNAIYGYLAQPDKQTKAAYMREVVMPGMARLLHRQPYDFTRPYDYNRQRAAFGCYHCHKVK
jgi:hypothetical protein